MKVSVVSYNILSPNYGDLRHFPRCDPDACNPVLRYQKIEAIFLKEMNRRQSILCLQEVTQDWLSKFVLFFNKHNYRIYYRSYDKAQSGYMGVAIAYPANLYSILDFKIVEPQKLIPRKNRKKNWITTISDFVVGYDETKDEWNRCTWKKNQGVWLKLSQNGKTFCVATVHMPCDYKRPTVMMVYTGLFLSEIQRMSIGFPLIFCGDFNFQPTSDYYKLITTGEIPKEFEFYPGSELEGDFRDIISNITKMNSAYKLVLGNEPRFTNHAWSVWSEKPFTGCLDYIFISPEITVSDFERLSDTVPERPFPTLVQPSDHLLIGATVVI